MNPQCRGTWYSIAKSIDYTQRRGGRTLEIIHVSSSRLPDPPSSPFINAIQVDARKYPALRLGMGYLEQDISCTATSLEMNPSPIVAIGCQFTCPLSTPVTPPRAAWTYLLPPTTRLPPKSPQPSKSRNIIRHTTSYPPQGPRRHHRA